MNIYLSKEKKKKKEIARAFSHYIGRLVDSFPFFFFFYAAELCTKHKKGPLWLEDVLELSYGDIEILQKLFRKLSLQMLKVL